MPDAEDVTPRTKRDKSGPDRDREWAIPPKGISGLTGVEGTMSWQAIDKFSQASRWTIGNAESDDETNLLPQLGSKLQLPGNGSTIATLAAPMIWKQAVFFNGGVFIFALSTNGNVYQVSAAGVITTVGTGFTTTGTVDIDVWQATQVMLSDSAAQKVFSWNGTTLTTVFTAQPVQFIRVFAGRLWMANNSTVQWTDANTNNSLAGSSGSFLITDGNCTNPIIGLLDFPSGLYVFGSNWWKTITGLVVQGTPAVLTFQSQTLEGNIGPISKWPVILVGSTVYFANTAGIWQLSGSWPVQISSPNMNGFFNNLTLANSSFSAAYGIVNSTPCIFWQAYYAGDTQVAAGYTVFGYTLQTGLWFRLSFGTIKWITGIVSSATANNQPVIWACDGTNIFTILSNTTSTVTSTWNSKLWDMGSALDIDSILSVFISFIVNGAITVTCAQLDETNKIKKTNTQTFNPSLGQLVNNFGVLGNGINNSGTQGQFQGTVASAYFPFQTDGVGRCRNMGINLTMVATGASFNNLVVSYRSTSAGKGS